MRSKDLKLFYIDIFFNSCLGLKIENYNTQMFFLNSYLNLKIENRNI